LRACAGHATTGQVTTATGELAAAEAGDRFARDWEALRADESIQFAPIVPPEPPRPPQWWLDFLEWLSNVLSPVGDFLSAIGQLLGLSGQAMLWLLGGLAATLVALLLWRALGGARRLRKRAVEQSAEWAPDAGEALALLEDADRLAGEGRYDEATHLLLRRSVGQLAAARPGLLEPSSTAREIAALPALPEGARGAFATIAERVERSLFALRRLSPEDWHAARAAYAEFALVVRQPALGAA